MTKRPKMLLALALPLLVSCMAWQTLAPLQERVLAEHSELGLDFSRPDALIESASLASLPKDLLRIPLLRDTLTEDFVFYYEGNADRLGITGALRRIAFEHDLGFRDSLINDLLDEPAEIALWRGADGKLKHALLSIKRGSLAKLLQPLAQVAADDKQLSKVGELHIDGVAAPVYRLRYNFDRAVLVIAHDDQLLLLSSASMLQESSASDSPLGLPETQQLEALLAKGSRFAARFGLGKRRSVHRISVSADYLAMGYGQFIPQLAGLRFEMKRQGWRSYLALNPSKSSDLDFAPLWASMPMGASLCAAVPLSQTTLQPLFERLRDLALAPELAAQLNGPAALCWYGQSRLHTPLLVTRLSGANPHLDTQLAQVFAQMIGAYEEKVEGGRFPIEYSASAATSRWSRVVGSSYGPHPAADFDKPELLSNDHYFRVALARHGETLLFSLDDALVDKALAVGDQRFPPLAEQLPKNASAPAYLASDSLATLLENEALQSLPAELEPIFRNAAESHLLPKLRALGQHQRYALTLSDTRAPKEWTWVALDWTAL